MAEDKKIVDLPHQPTPLERGDPVEAHSVATSGSTFAERAKARAKQVDSEDVEDKAVKKVSKK